MTLINCKPRHHHNPHGQFDRMWREIHKNACHEQECESGWSPRVDIVEQDKSFEIVVEVPGFEKSDVSLKMEENVLTLSGERKMEEEAEGRDYRRVERLYGNFERKFRLPRGVETEQIEAELKNGLLTITIAKSDKVAGREIEVK